MERPPVTLAFGGSASRRTGLFPSLTSTWHACESAAQNGPHCVKAQALLLLIYRRGPNSWLVGTMLGANVPPPNMYIGAARYPFVWGFQTTIVKVPVKKATMIKRRSFDNCLRLLGTGTQRQTRKRARTQDPTVHRLTRKGPPSRPFSDFGHFDWGTHMKIGVSWFWSCPPKMIAEGSVFLRVKKWLQSQGCICVVPFSPGNM